MNAPTYARPVIYSVIKIGHRHEFVSRRTTAIVDIHCIARTKNTISVNAVSGVHAGTAVVRLRIANRRDQRLRLFVLVLADVIDNAQRRDQHFPCGKTRDQRDADLPVEPERPYDRFDRMTELPGITVLELFALR